MLLRWRVMSRRQNRQYEQKPQSPRKHGAAYVHRQACIWMFQCQTFCRLEATTCTMRRVSSRVSHSNPTSNVPAQLVSPCPASLVLVKTRLLNGLCNNKNNGPTVIRHVADSHSPICELGGGLCATCSARHFGLSAFRESSFFLPVFSFRDPVHGDWFSPAPPISELSPR